MVHGLDDVRLNFILFNKKTFGNIFKKKHRIEGRLRGVQTCLENQYQDTLF